MDCTLVYALVPRDTLEGVVTCRAEHIWTQLQSHADQTMILEEPKAEWSDASHLRQLDEIIRSRSLWSQSGDEK